jgi:hypothetical protein
MLRRHKGEEAQKNRAFTSVRESFGESGFNLRAIAANISELLRSVDKPPLAELPFFIGCQRVTQTIYFLTRHF